MKVCTYICTSETFMSESLQMKTYVIFRRARICILIIPIYNRIIDTKLDYFKISKKWINVDMKLGTGIPFRKGPELSLSDEKLISQNLRRIIGSHIICNLLFSVRYLVLQRPNNR